VVVDVRSVAATALAHIKQQLGTLAVDGVAGFLLLDPEKLEACGRMACETIRRISLDAAVCFYTGYTREQVIERFLKSDAA